MWISYNITCPISGTIPASGLLTEKDYTDILKIKKPVKEVLTMSDEKKEELVLSLLELLPNYFQYFNNFTDIKEKQLTKTQLRILLILSAQKSLSMSQLSERLCISREQATRAVAPLAHRNLVFRSTHDTNRRQLDVGLTNSGIALLAELKAEYIRHMEVSLSRLSEEEKTLFTESLHNIIAIMAKMVH